jgi:hypothetical protein
MLRLLAGLLALIITISSMVPAQAAHTGFYLLPIGDVSDPVAHQTVTFDPDTDTWNVWTGSVWATLTYPFANFTATVDPTVSDDSSLGYAVGSQWLNVSSSKAFVCTSASVGAAVWVEVNPTIDLTGKLTTADVMSDFVVSGLLGSAPISSLSMTTPLGVAYVDGSRISVSASAFTYTVSKDTYDFVQSDGTYIHHAVNNGDPAPTDTGVLTQKVITDGTQITAVNDLRQLRPYINADPAQNSNQVVTLGQADANYISSAWATANGDLIVGSGAGTSSVLNEGANSTLLGVVPSGTGLQYWSLIGAGRITVTPSGSTMTVDGSGIVFPEKLTTADVFTTDWVVSGMATGSATLVFSAAIGVAYVDGLRVESAAIAATEPISQDNYWFLQTDGTWIQDSVNNGDPAPTDTGLLVFKVVTDATTITSIDLLASSTPHVDSLTLNSLGTATLLAGHVISTGSTPAIAGGSGAGGAAVLSVSGTDTAGTITITTDVGDTPAASATVATITFATAFSAAPRVLIMPANDAAWDLAFGVVRCSQADASTTQFLLKSSSTPLPATTAATYKFNYLVVQ